jgi:hypothetical protein
VGAGKRPRGTLTGAGEGVTMSAPSFSKISNSYAKLWAGMVVAPAHQAACDRAARAILAYKKQYVTVSTETSVPWFVIGMIDMMEAGGGCRRHLHNGDSLLHRTGATGSVGSMRRVRPSSCCRRKWPYYAALTTKVPLAKDAVTFAGIDCCVTCRN